ncbi:MAG: hypothetical protein KUL88_06640 [Rhizobium sp.]|nr:hypothetical protein [Rhizobium sp.]
MKTLQSMPEGLDGRAFLLAIAVRNNGCPFSPHDFSRQRFLTSPVLLSFGFANLPLTQKRLLRHHPGSAQAPVPSDAEEEFTADGSPLRRL